MLNVIALLLVVQLESQAMMKVPVMREVTSMVCLTSGAEDVDMVEEVDERLLAALPDLVVIQHAQQLLH